MKYRLEIRGDKRELFAVITSPAWKGEHDTHAFPVLQDDGKPVSRVLPEDLPRSWGIQGNELRIFHPYSGAWMASKPLGTAPPTSEPCRFALNPRNRKCAGCDRAAGRWEVRA